jgi:pyruvate dehydrogenase E1 component alpha subunit
MHVVDLGHGNLGTNGIVGGGIPLAAGAALAFRARGENRVAVAFFGDGALNQGLLHECMNMAAVWKLPVVFVCENNGYGEYTAIEDVTAGPNLCARGEVFGITSLMVDGMDVLTVLAETRWAVDRARAGEGPSFIICNTWRYGGHHVGDKQTYKEFAETEAWKQRDPILRLAGHMLENGFSLQMLEDINHSVEVLVANALSIARASPEPSPALLEAHVYAQ